MNLNFVLGPVATERRAAKCVCPRWAGRHRIHASSARSRYATLSLRHKQVICPVVLVDSVEGVNLNNDQKPCFICR